MDAALNALLTADAFQLLWILIHHDAKYEPEDSQGHVTEVTDDHDEEMIGTTGNRAADIEPDNLQTQAFSEAETVSDDNLSHPAFSEARVSTGDDDLDVAAAFLEKVLDGDILPEKNVLESLSRISTKLQKHKEHLSDCRAGRLWLQYLELVAILRRSIKAERTGNFELHQSGHVALLSCLWAQQLPQVDQAVPSTDVGAACDSPRCVPAFHEGSL